jgi:hypothetical protein
MRLQKTSKATFKENSNICKIILNICVVHITFKDQKNY